mgnify:FL=1|jgi:hypothetical protein|tara:strand:+ start:21 stop:644 length:624 start_codon:yes stop_codon:yes gene_type:complete
MAITTYAELKTSITDFLNRDDLTTVTPTFILLAEADMQRRVRHWRQEKRSNANLNSRYSDVPGDFLEVIRFGVTGDNNSTLEMISQSQMLDRRMQNGNTSGSPRYYALTAGEIELFPSPSAITSTELYYYSKIDALSASTASNWMLENHPDAYLYGSLVHSAPYLSDDSRITMWAALYQAAIDAINAESESVKFGGSGRRLNIRGLS